MVRSVADTGGSTESGDYRVGYAVEKAEGMYEWADGELVCGCRKTNAQGTVGS